jgi:uncharacterized membrane protein YhiD involved in acid resistance
MQTESPLFSSAPIALKMAVAIGIGMLVGMEREWSNKDVDVRTFAIVAWLGMLASLNKRARLCRSADAAVAP